MHLPNPIHFSTFSAPFLWNVSLSLPASPTPLPNTVYFFAALNNLAVFVTDTFSIWAPTVWLVWIPFASRCIKHWLSDLIKGCHTLPVALTVKLLSWKHTNTPGFPKKCVYIIVHISKKKCVALVFDSSCFWSVENKSHFLFLPSWLAAKFRIRFKMLLHASTYIAPACASVFLKTVF